MNALAKEEVGSYLNQHFVSSFQKVGTFRIVGRQKQGGNVASYFCTPNGQVLHAVAGPVDGDTMLREARWVVENWKLAQLHMPVDATRLMAFFRKAHADRLMRDYGIETRRVTFPAHDPTAAVLASMFDPTSAAHGRKNDPAARALGLDKQGRVHLLLAYYPLVRVGQVYELVFERILGEKISTLPVAKAG